MPHQTTQFAEDHSKVNEALDVDFLSAPVRASPVNFLYGETDLARNGKLHPTNDHIGLDYVQSSISVERSEEDQQETVDENCGCGSFRPACLRGCNNAVWLLFWLSLAAFTQSMLVNGLLNVIITTIEKRYHLSSKDSGLIASSFDIASLVVILPVSYFGGAGSRPRWLAGGMAILGIGSLIFSVPHFITGNYQTAINATNLCVLDGMSGKESPEQQCSSPDSRFQYVFIFANLLHGIGAAPLYTLGVSFLDDSVKATMSPIVVGIYYAMSMLGPAAGYVIGGQLLSIYIDFNRVSSWTLTDSSPGWLGAWWIGFVVLGFIAIVLSVPLFLFPAVLPNTRKYKSERVNEAYGSAAANTESAAATAGKIKHLPAAIRSLLRNKTFICLNFATASEAFFISGCATYAPKILESQYGYSAANASLIVGAITVPLGALGTVIGGYVVKRFALKMPGILRMATITSSVTLVTILLFLMKCPNVRLAGVSISHSDVSSYMRSDNLISSCNQQCNCASDRFDPVCGTEIDVMFLTPCHAGCKPGKDGEAAQEFTDCLCIPSSADKTKPIATRAACPTDCGYFNYLFMVMIGLFMFCTTLSSIPAVTATLRSVSADSRPSAMGLQWLTMRAFGSIPGPLVFGAVIDTACSYWQKEPCGNGLGRCLLYDNSLLAMSIFTIGMICKVATLTFFSSAWYLYKAPPGNPEEKVSVENPLAIIAIPDNLTSSTKL